MEVFPHIHQHIQRGLVREPGRRLTLLRVALGMAGVGTSSGRDLCLPVLSPVPRLSRASPVPSLCGGCAWRAEQRARPDGGTAPFLSWDVSSHSLASLAAELPEDKRSDYKADQGQER